MMFLMSLQINKTIRLYRMKAGISQEALAQKAGLTKNYIGLIERGIFTNIGLESLTKIAGALNLDLAKLVRESQAA